MLESQPAHGPPHRPPQVDHLLRSALHPQADRQDSRCRRDLPAAESLGTGAHRVRAAALADTQRQQPLAHGPEHARGAAGPRPAHPAAVEGPLAALGPVRLALADGRGQVREWNAWVDRYHPLGYRQPIGAHLRYFVLDGPGRKLGCLLFDFAVRKVACRDEWIGWAGQKYRKHLKLVVRNARFLLFPWVGVKNLASHVLGLAARQVAAGWQRQHRYRPVLLETYVDSERYAGTCYRAAGWQCVGKTQGRKAQGRNPAVTPKAVYVRPLHPRWQQALLQGPRALARKKSAARAGRRGARDQRVGPRMDAAPAAAQHPAGGAVRLPAGARAPQPGLRGDGDRVVGPVPPA